MENILGIKEGCLANATSEEIAFLAVKILDSKKADDIKILKIDTKTIIADYFVICTGNSTTQVKTLADETEYRLGIAGVPDIRLEGSNADDWKVVDCNDVIIHTFSQSAREFYKLDRLWADCEEIDINKILNS